PYYDAIAGGHLGVFPSIYEPWGYTPLEAAAMGVPSVTTDLSGFSSLIKPALPKENPGIFILECYKKTREEIVNGLFNILYNFSRLTHEERVENKMNAKKLARLSDWETLIENYIKAHNIALSK
ncbi:MAG: glycosyltransferase, partial [Candidatus Sumerlaeia bacterium]|nr:glycosyltransferase [Candidatus Sumerlaeia bacterium]